MLKETIELESLRQKIEDAEYEWGSQSDYIDRGKPNEQQKKQAQQIIARMMAKSKELKAKLHDMIVLVRRENPQAFEDWIKIHKDFLERVLAEKKPGPRQNVARATLTEWEKVSAGDQEYIGINWYFLKDYKADVRKAFKKNPLRFWK